jgi:hypothetical protein
VSAGGGGGYGGFGGGKKGGGGFVAAVPVVPIFGGFGGYGGHKEAPAPAPQTIFIQQQPVYQAVKQQPVYQQPVYQQHYVAQAVYQQPVMETSAISMPVAASGKQEPILDGPEPVMLPTQELPVHVVQYAVPSTHNKQQNMQRETTQQFTQPVIQRIINQPVPIISTEVERVIQPIVNRVVQPIVTTTTKQGQPAQPVLATKKSAAGEVKPTEPIMSMDGEQ